MIRVLVLALAAAAIAAPAGMLSDQPASASPAHGPGVKFLMRYKGSLEGTYSSVQPVATSSNQFVCPGFEETRSMSSSVRPAKPYYLIVSKPFGSLEMEFFPEPHGSTKGVVNLDRTARGFLMTCSGGQCVRRDTTPPGCGAKTFRGQATPLVPVGGSFEAGRWRVYLQWQLEPDTVGCVATSFVLGNFGDAFEQTAARLDLKKLYRCGIQRPRGCKVTLGGKKSYSDHQQYQDANGPVTRTATARLEWQVTFVAVGKA